MTATSSSTGAASRRQVSFNGARVPNLYVRTTATGETRFEFSRKIGGVVRKTTLSARSARQAVSEIESLRPLARQGLVGSGTARLGELVEAFLAEAEAGTFGTYSSSTVDLYRQRLTDHVLPALGESRRIRDVTEAVVQELADRLVAAKLSGSTVRGTITALGACFKFAKRRGLVQANPCRSLSLPSGQRRRQPTYLSRPDAEALLAALSDEFRPAAACLLYTGLRASESLGLQWGDLDLAEGTMRVERQMGRDGRTLVALKTEASAATLAMPTPLVAELRAHRDRQARIGFERIGPEALVFVTRNGHSPGRRNLLRAIQTQAERLGLEGVGSHALRHSAAGLLRSAGLGDETIAATLRHSSTRVTQAVYGGMSPDDLTAIRQKAAAALS